MVVGSVHLVETFEFFHTLRRNNWQGVWQLDQFPFREDSVQAAKQAITLPQSPPPGARRPRRGGAGRGPGPHDALAAQKLVQKVLLSSMIDQDN